MKHGKTLLFFVAGIILLSIDACSNPFLQKNGNGGRNIGPGSGQADDPFLVRTVDDLRHVGNPELDTKYADWGLDMHYKQTADINLTSITNWTPIGYNTLNPNDPNQFKGSYDGNGHKILNLNISDENQSYQGLFSDIGATGIVKNLNMVDINISVTSSCVGGVAGENYGTIQNCYISGSIIGHSGVGGVAGENYGILQNCYVTGDIKGGIEIGGVAGYNYTYFESIGIVQNCYTNCTISGTNWYCGGIVGNNISIVQNCYAVGSVSGQACVGGVTGNTGSLGGSYFGTMRNCVALNGLIGPNGAAAAGTPINGRITGSDNSVLGEIENNYAWGAMTIQDKNGVAKGPLDEGLNGIDGEPLSASDIKTKLTWTSSENWNTTDEGAEAWDFTNIWVWDNTGTNMPRLKNCPALPWPAYLQ